MSVTDFVLRFVMMRFIFFSGIARRAFENISEVAECHRFEVS